MSENKPLSLPGTTPQGSVIGADRAPTREAVSPELEAMARAIYAHAGSSPSGQPTWDEEDAEMHEWFFGHARAALLAIRTPSDRMSHEGAHASHPTIDSSWTAMVDVILGERG